MDKCQIIFKEDAQNIIVDLGGRVAEELIFDDITTGASQDIKQATKTARDMVTRYGMSEHVGLICYTDDDDEVFIGRDLAHTRSYGENVAALIDSEVKRLIDEAYAEAKKIITEHKEILDSCATLLLAHEKVTREEFEDMIANAQLLEYTEYCGNYYGTPKKAVVDMLEQGKDVILKIEIEGAANVKKMFPEATLIFILPPSMNELSRRLHKRGTEDEATIAKRLETARKELAFAKNYDYAIVNGDLDKAIDDFMAVISAEKFTVKRNLDLIKEIEG